MSSDSITAIKESLPPASDYLTYLTILESHLSPEILPTLNEILQDAELTKNIGWDLVQLLLPLPGAEQCLTTIARLGNPREVVLKVTEAFQSLELDDAEEAEENEAETPAIATAEPTPIDKFCTLVGQLSILHPRIKTKFPSRFLSATLMAILRVYRPSNQATLAVISFVHTISGKKRPTLPERKSTLSLNTMVNDAASGPSAPDPEAQEEDPHEKAIQTKLIQSFVTHILEEYINANPLEWSARLLEHFQPKKVIPVKKSMSEAFREDPPLVTRDTIAGKLVALSRDLGLSEYPILLETIHKPNSTSADEDSEDNYPSSPADIPLSRAGCLFLVAFSVFSSILFDSPLPLPDFTLFPQHAKLLTQFVGLNGAANIGSEETGVIDSILAIGLWLENSNKFVAGPLEDEDFLEYLQALSLLSANTPSPTLRYAAHVLTSAILHAHPVDRLRLTFITDTLENCPYETLKASAVSWLKEEIMTAQERESDNVFATTIALAAAQPYLFPDTSALLQANSEELIQELTQSWPFHMAVANFLYFISGEGFRLVVPEDMFTIVEEIYLGPLERALKPAKGVFEGSEGGGEEEEIARDRKFELELLDQRIVMCRERMAEWM